MLKKRVSREFGKRVRDHLKTLRLTPEALADQAAFDRIDFGVIERGQRNLSLLKICCFAEAVRTTASTLLEGM